MPTTLKGPWSLRETEQFLEDSRFPLRLACTSRDGYPRVVSVWYAPVDGALLCVSHRKAALIRLLEHDPRVGFEVSPNDPPYHGVRGQGTASLAPLGDHDVLETLLDRYLGQQDSRVGNWLLSRKDEEMLITVRPERLFSWDYRQRMADVSAGRVPK